MAGASVASSAPDSLKLDAGSRLVSVPFGSRLHTPVLLRSRPEKEEFALTALRTARRPFAFPSGGSDALGCWGYIEAVAELERQLHEERQLSTQLDRIYFSCGSGGTAAGLALGLHLSSLDAELVMAFLNE